ncbi:MAG: NAD-dependent epimerase/dehydratase family protein [Nanoarchaeota archaeon]|nr:NAD-dependent epimerase/dehydratase family protein [Nanoarchaeota archaeon]MBU1622174.1 NAD-dependent epimerase/dehydratase family protein [Nanoarchaeota archaeon]
MEKIDEILVSEKLPIKEVMKTIDNIGLGIAIIVDESSRLKGTVTDGDIRRAIMRGVDVNSKISLVMNKNPFKIKGEINQEKILEELKKNSRNFPDYYMLKIPVLDEEDRVVDIFIESGREGGFKFSRKEEKIPKPVEKILVVGGAGYLGSILCRKLVSRGYKVKVLDLLMFGEEPILSVKNNPNFEFIHGDMRDITTLTKTLKGVDAVILLAAIVGDPASQNQPTSTIETNYFATMTLAQACKYHQINRFIFASTCSVYGLSDQILDENAELNPVSLYARSKIESEKGILSLVDENFSPTILRMGTLYGLSPRMRFDLVVNIFAMKALLEKKITVFGGDQWRPLLNVEDAAEAFIKCIKAPIKDIRGQVFNVGSNEQNYQIKALGQIVKATLPETEVIITNRDMIDGKEDARDYNVSFDKIRTVLGFTPQKTVQESIIEISQAIQTKKIANVKDAQYYNNR